MPELPEVETIRRRLQTILPGKVISHVTIHHPKSFGGDPDQVLGQQIVVIGRKAKLLRFQFANGLNLLTHLKMTGQLMYLDDKNRIGGGHPTADWVRELPSAHTRITYTFSDQSKLFFNDQRIFGWMRVMTDDQVLVEWARYAPDAIDPVVTPDYMFQQLQRRSVPIKQAIMMNDIIAGVGNIYAAEALHQAQLSPLRPARSLSKAEVTKLLAAIKQVMQEGIALGGTTFDGAYVDIDGLAGSYQNKLQVYGQAGKPCTRCGGIITKTTLGGRGTYYCASCQI